MAGAPKYRSMAALVLDNTRIVTSNLQRGGTETQIL